MSYVDGCVAHCFSAMSCLLEVEGSAFVCLLYTENVNIIASIPNPNIVPTPGGVTVKLV